MKTLFRALLVTLLLTPGFAGAQSHLSSDPAVVQSRVLVMNGRFEAALAVLRPLDPEGPGKIDILFLTGLAAMGAAEAREDDDEREALLDEAIAALRAILVDRPELTRVRLELARAFFLAGDDRLARDQFERVLAGGPAPPVVANINLYLARIRKRRRWTSYIGASIAEDSNVGAASDSEFIYIFGLPFRRNEESLATSGTGLVVWGGVEYQHPLSERWRLRAGTDLVRHEYAGANFDRLSAAAHLGPRWLVTADTEMNLLATAGQRWTAGHPRNHTLGTRFEVRHRLSRRLRVRGEVSWKHRDFESSEHLDGPLLGLVGSTTWFPTSTVRVGAAAGYNRERTTSLRLAQRHALGAGGRLGGPALRLHPRRRRRAAVDPLQGAVGPVHPRRRAPQGPDPGPSRHVAQPLPRRVRIQPPNRARARGAGLQRAALRLPAHPHRAHLPAPVLTPEIEPPRNGPPASRGLPGPAAHPPFAQPVSSRRLEARRWARLARS